VNESAVRRYLALARREWWVVLQAVIVVALVAGLIAHRNQTVTYKASAQLYVESAVGPDGTLPLVAQTDFFGNTTPSLSDALATSLARQASSAEVLAGAAKSLGGHLVGTVATTLNPASRTLTITATAATPEQATKLANAVAKSFVDARWKERSAALQRQISATATQLHEIQQQITKVNNQENVARFTGADTSSFETAKSVWLAQYQAAFSTQQQLQSSLQTRDNGVPFLLPAQGAVKVESANTLTRVLEGAAIGFIIGIGLAALRESLDAKVRDREWVEEVTGLHTVGELPKERGLRKHRLGVVDAPESLYSEMMRALRGSLMWAADGGALVSISVTSPQSGDGKTTVATNLAAAFALSGVQTVLVSADFRAPTMHGELLPYDDSAWNRPVRGLAEILIDDESSDDAAALESGLVETRVDHLRWLPATLAVSPTTARATKAAERLSSDRARRLLGALSSISELIVIDTPPALLSEAASINALVDGVVLVVRPGSTRRAAVRRIVRAWKGSPVTPLGVVLNGTRPAHEDTVSSKSASTWRSRREEPGGMTWPTTTTLPPPTANGNANGNGNGQLSGAKPEATKPSEPA
jgi:capsular exopolysaccharide synthesis family protein